MKCENKSMAETSTEEILIEEPLSDQLLLGIPNTPNSQSQRCYLTQPVWFSTTTGGPAGGTWKNWNYSEITCFSSTTELISNQSTGGKFYLDKTLNYGDAILIWFATLFTFYLIFKTAYNFFWKK
jgi:hypothetical protein